MAMPVAVYWWFMSPRAEQFRAAAAECRAKALQTTNTFIRKQWDALADTVDGIERRDSNDLLQRISFNRY
jgi:hypothetical protein